METEEGSLTAFSKMHASWTSPGLSASACMPEGKPHAVDHHTELVLPILLPILLQITLQMPQLQNLQKVKALRQAMSQSTWRVLKISRLRHTQSKMQYIVVRLTSGLPCCQGSTCPGVVAWHMNHHGIVRDDGSCCMVAGMLLRIWYCHLQLLGWQQSLWWVSLLCS